MQTLLNSFTENNLITTIKYKQINSDNLLNKKNKEQISELIHSDIKIFLHHIYEYEKGLRNLVLHTGNTKHRSFIEKRLSHKKIPYFIQYVTENKINVFFGNKSCIEVLKNFGRKNLNEFSDEEDFILGIMLGYDRIKQCERYTKRKDKKIFQ